MIAERFPELVTLDPEEQLILAGELVRRATSGDDASSLDPAAMELIEARLDGNFKFPESGVRWMAAPVTAREFASEDLVGMNEIAGGRTDNVAVRERLRNCSGGSPK